jgi:hypothetical protein
MANYIVRECTSETTYVVSADTLNIDDVISFYFGESISCGVVVNETTDDYDYVLNHTESGCCDCLTANTSYQSFTFERCDNEELIYITLQTFCGTYGGSPIGGTVWNLFNLETSENVCATFLSANTEESGVTVWIPDEGPFNSCGNCNISIPRSASTETFLCQQICTESGTTVVSVAAPHPVWTDGYGTAVTQMNMITLGGNGLNA